MNQLTNRYACLQMQLALRLIIFSLFWFAALLYGPQVAGAQTTWHADVGAESHDQAKQALAFLPNEMWIHANDSIQWTFVPQNEPHTVTLLTATQPRPVPPPPVGPPIGGCPGITPDVPTPSYTGASCVTSAPLSGGASYTVTFPTVGNYKLVCLVHTNMNGTIHVLPALPVPAALPFDQADYYKQASDEAKDLINDSDNVQQKLNNHQAPAGEVVMGGEVAATGGGRQSLAVVRFFPGTIHIKAGQTVEWTNLDPTTPHTITFGTEPPVPQVTVNVTQDPDGALHGTVALKTDTVNSGFLQAAPEDAVGFAESPVFITAPFPPGNTGLTRIRITFPNKGTYNYKCALHDADGMLGTVIVD